MAIEWWALTSEHFRSQNQMLVHFTAIVTQSSRTSVSLVLWIIEWPCVELLRSLCIFLFFVVVGGALSPLIVRSILSCCLNDTRVFIKMLYCTIPIRFFFCSIKSYIIKIYCRASFRIIRDHSVTEISLSGYVHVQWNRSSPTSTHRLRCTGRSGMHIVWIPDCFEEASHHLYNQAKAVWNSRNYLKWNLP